MTDLSKIDQIALGVERLVLRYEELQRNHIALLQHTNTLERERDSLKSRLGAARARIDTLIDRLPVARDAASNLSTPTSQGDQA
jgi:cell division protein ZapB